MTPVTDDPSDPRLTHGADAEPVRQADAYLVLSKEERARGFVRPVRTAYLHVGAPGKKTVPAGAREPGEGCGAVTTMGTALAETYARQPDFYGATYCVHCGKHLPVGAGGEFVWDEPGGPHATEAEYQQHLQSSPRVGT